MDNTRGPVIVQGSEAPVFVGVGDDTFRCSKCQHTLIGGFRTQNFADIEIECFKCHAISRTPGWEEKGPFPRQLLSMGERGRFLVKGTVNAHAEVTVASGREIDRVIGLYGIRNPDESPLALNAQSLRDFVEVIDLITNSMLSNEIGRARRARNARNPRFLSRSYLAWSIDRLQVALENSQLDLSGDEGVALNLLHVARHLIQRWGHHPLFPLLARELVSNFHHGATSLIVASYLAENGNRIGFTDTPAMTGRSPDLYVKLDATDHAAIEVKAPPALQWPNINVQVEKTVAAQLRSAKTQITGSHGGLVVIGSSLGSPTPVVDAIRSLTIRGQVSSRISAVVSVSFPVQDTFRIAADQRLDFNWGAKVVPVTNPRFVGPDYLRTEGES